MNNPVIIIGANNLGRLALDSFGSNNVLIYGFLDTGEKLFNTEIAEVMILGDYENEDYLNIIGDKAEVFVAIENQTHKENIIKLIQEKRQVMPVNAIHSHTSISEDAEVGHGILISAGVIISSGAIIGNHTVIHPSASIGPLAQIAEYVEIGQGAIIGSNVSIEKGAFIGAGAVLVSGIKIGINARVGAGSVVIENVPNKATVFGNPAKNIEK